MTDASGVLWLALHYPVLIPLTIAVIIFIAALIAIDK